MSRIPTPATIEAAPTAAQASLTAAKAKIGIVPNLHRLIANSPAALQAYLGFGEPLGHGALDARTRERIALTVNRRHSHDRHLDARTRERIALAVAEANGCGYCLAAHSYIGKNMAKLDEVEIAANRHGRSTDAKADAAVRFAAQIVAARGHVAAADVQAVKDAGYTDGQIVEIVTHVALNTLTNYVNEVFQTEIDFPLAAPLAHAA